MDTSVTAKATEAELANSIRALAMDAVEAAKSGHPGMPMGMAEIAVALWKRHLRHNPAHPDWPNRDRFVLSNGHGSMLLYSLLHLTGYALPIEELKRFRQLGSKTPGHPERGCAPGVETTTGPLGQGLANAVGMALAERLLAARFNKPDHELVEHFTYVFLGDGCMMEGISHEACALAGTLGLGKLIALYDDNGISIDSDKGQIKQWYTDDVRKRFESYGWQVIPNVDGHDVEAVDKAIRKAKRGAKAGERSRPTLICCKTVIAKGAPKKANTGAAHGAPLGAEEIAATRAAIGWPHAAFEIPKPVYDGWDARESGKRLERRWQKLLKSYQTSFPEDAAEFERRMKGELPADFDGTAQALLADFNSQGGDHRDPQGVAERSRSLGSGAAGAGRRLGRPDRLQPHHGEGLEDGVAGHAFRQPHLLWRARVRHVRGDERPRAARRADPLWRHLPGVLRLRAQRAAPGRVDGLAHDLRVLPRLDRPGRGRPDAPAHRARSQPAADTQYGCLASVRYRRDRRGLGGGVAAQERPHRAPPDSPERPISEKGIPGWSRQGRLCTRRRPRRPRSHHRHRLRSRHRVEAQKQLAAAGMPVRLVSMPSTSVFDRQDAEYRNSVLPAGLPKVAVEAGVSDYWRKYVGTEGAVVGIDRYGESAPAGDLFKHFGFTPDNIIKVVRSIVQ